MTISSFKNRKTARFFHGEFVSDFQGIAPQARRRLSLLNEARSLVELTRFGGNRLEALRGDRSGQYSIRINRQWRICFRWASEGPYEVEIVDYH